jgi:UDP-N-acetylglucosamine 2-epimerase (non-hydrolysing)
MAPVIRAIGARPTTFEQLVVTTGQHREMLDQVMGAFGLEPDIDLDLMRPDHRIGEFAARALRQLTDLLVSRSPDLVLIQGDTTTVLCAALAAFWLGIPLGHVEAGLRSHDRQQPFPEELNREVAGLAAHFHFAPTPRARDNLLRQDVPPERVWITGNTIVDALGQLELRETFSAPALRSVDFEGSRVILVTAHRRESHGPPLAWICAAVRTIAERFPDTQVIFPVHLNPRVQRVVHHELDGVARVLLTEPLGYPDLLRVISGSFLILTDSGGIQEEAPSFHKPALVLREVTERPEAVDAGLAELVGTDPGRIVRSAARLLTDAGAYAAMTNGTNPFGDGRAGERIASILADRLKPDGRRA